MSSPWLLKKKKLAKCNRQTDRYILYSVKILEGLGKKCGGTCSYAKFSSRVSKFHQLIWSSVLKLLLYFQHLLFISSLLCPIYSIQALNLSQLTHFPFGKIWFERFALSKQIDIWQLCKTSAISAGEVINESADKETGRFEDFVSLNQIVALQNGRFCV